MIAQCLKAPPKRIAQEYRCFITDFTTYHAAFKSGYDEAVAEVMEKLHGLDCLDPEDTERISPAINDAARCYYSAHWWPLFRQAIRKRYRMKASIAFVVVVLFILPICNVLPKPRTANMTGYNISSCVILAEILLIVGSVFYFLIPYRYRTAFLMTGAGVALLAVAKFPTFQSWSSHVLPARRELAPPSTLVLWLLALACIPIVVRRSINFLGKAFASGLESGYGRPAEQCAELTLEFLEVSSIINDLLGRIQGKVTDDEDMVWLSDAKLPSNYARQNIERHLARLAYLARKPWREAMRSCNGKNSVIPWGRSGAV